MAGDQADVPGADVKRGDHRVIGLLRGLVPPHGLIDAEPPLEQVYHACPGQLAPGDLQRVVGQREQPEAMITEPAQRHGDVRMGRHRGEPAGELVGVGVADRDALGVGQHAEHGRADVGERDVDASERERLGVGNQPGEP
jgi:hypothetical protein